MDKIFWWPIEIQQYVKEVHEAIDPIADSIVKNTSALNASELAQFKSLYQNYVIWHNNLSWLSYTTAATLNIADRYKDQFKYWSAIFSAKTGNKIPGPGFSLLDPIKASGNNNMDSVKFMVSSISLTVGLVAIARIVRS